MMFCVFSFRINDTNLKSNTCSHVLMKIRCFGFFLMETFSDDDDLRHRNVRTVS